MSDGTLVANPVEFMLYLSVVFIDKEWRIYYLGSIMWHALCPRQPGQPRHTRQPIRKTLPPTRRAINPLSTLPLCSPTPCTHHTLEAPNTPCIMSLFLVLFLVFLLVFVILF